MKYCNIYLLTFLITGIYDLILQLSINGYIPLLDKFLKNTDWYISLKDYFKRHTPLSAILLAGFIGFITQIIIFNIIYLKNINIDILGLIHSNNRMLMLLNIIKFLVISFIISGLIGIPIKMSNLFPILEDTYYKKLGDVRSFITDGYSGLIVQITLLVILYLINSYIH